MGFSDFVILEFRIPMCKFSGQAQKDGHSGSLSMVAGSADSVK